MQAREAEAQAQNIYDQKREEFELVEEQFQQDLLARKDEILEALFGSAEEEDPAVMLQYAAATPDALRSVLTAAAVSENLRVIQQVILACDARELNDILDMVGDLLPDAFGDLLGELSQIDGKLEDLGDPGELFETLAPDPPTREKILTR